MAIAAGLLACAVGILPPDPAVADTFAHIVSVESRGNPLAINVNHWSGVQPVAATVDDAVTIANRFISAGYSVDMGPAQINSRNLGRLGYSVADAFDPCKGIAGGAIIYAGFYHDAAARFGDGDQARLAAVSAYNTGSFQEGFSNGYVSKVVGVQPTQVIQVANRDSSPGPVVRSVQRVASVEDPYTAGSSVFSAGGNPFHVD